MVLMQIMTDVTGPESANQSLSVIDLTLKGGFMMIPIVLLSFVAIYIFFERFLTIRKANQDPDAFMHRIKEQVLKGDINGAKLLCSQTDSPIARMIEKGISRIGSPLKNIEASIENVGKIEIFKLEKNLSTLATISGAAPMMGFLGTVIGMVKAFISISQQEGSVSPKLLSDGIYTAMITTVAGLVVGIIAYLAYNYLVSRVQKVIHKMEYTSIDFVDLLQEPR
ncbi:MAG: MotA/TolQ/ExbB proton channel family protein [Cyclobacteriaceae bacterium]|nr:MotA/TolQ/ExbB proton channel family protein [Cyclobacteriaceae bacterium]MBX2957169.1 MotA/TolQ/ExbB proton channel family protein [Cyclobacteriaceae bacterium]